MARRVLIIEDDDSARACYGRLLRRHGYETALEADGLSVERNLEQYRDVDLVILDYRMPGLDGLQLLARLRGRRFQAPAVLVTASAIEEIEGEARRLGVKRIFGKPLSIPGFLRAVEELLAAGVP